MHPDQSIRRLRSTTLSLLLFLVIVSPLRVDAVEDVDRLLVINGLSETLTLVDRAGDSIVPNILTLGLSPNRIRMAADAILIVNSISDDVWVLDPSAFTVTHTIVWPDGDNPWDIVAINDTLAAMTMLAANAVVLMNYTTGDTLARFPVGKSPEGIVSADGNLWVTNTGFDFGTYLYDPGTVSVLDASSGTVLATIPVGTNPQSLVPVADGTIHVLCTGDYWSSFGVVYVIDRPSMTVIDSIPLGGSPGDLAVSHDGTAYVAAGGWADSGTVFVYDALARTVGHGAANPWRTANGATAVVPRLEGGAYAVCFGGDSVIAHTAAGGMVTAFQVGDGPQAALYITNRRPGDLDENGSVDAVDLAAMIDRVFFGGAPPQRPGSADLDGNCVHDAVDLGKIIDLVFFGGHDYVWGCAP